jgi:hypothetical protein
MIATFLISFRFMPACFTPEKTFIFPSQPRTLAGAGTDPLL